MDLITRLRSGHDHLKIVLGDLLKRIQLTKADQEKLHEDNKELKSQYDSISQKLDHLLS